MIPTPHISAQKEDIARIVIMPGDPMRSEWIAKTFLTDPRLVNDVRGVHGYTGMWNDTEITVMASGMGIPSISIYAYELYNFYDVDLIIRTGTCGSIQPDVHVSDVVLADIAYTNSSFLNQFALPEGYLPKADPKLLAMSIQVAEDEIKKNGYASNIHVGPVLTEEIYYSTEHGLVSNWALKGVLAFEMEAAALFANADQAGKKALSVFTVSNNIRTGVEMPPKERETSLTQMVNIALGTAERFAESYEVD